MLSTSVLLALSGVALAQQATTPAACLDLSNSADAQAYARTVDVAALQKGNVGAVCFEGGQLKLDPVPDILTIFSQDGTAQISGKFTAANGAVTPLRCDLPKDSITELLKTVSQPAVVKAED